MNTTRISTLDRVKGAHSSEIMRNGGYLDGPAHLHYHTTRDLACTVTHGQLIAVLNPSLRSRRQCALHCRRISRSRDRVYHLLASQMTPSLSAPVCSHFGAGRKAIDVRRCGGRHANLPRCAVPENEELWFVYQTSRISLRRVDPLDRGHTDMICRVSSAAVAVTNCHRRDIGACQAMRAYERLCGLSVWVRS